jgi:hypothetical protein
MLEWNNFFMAEAGASAALAGLVFVGISINLTKIMSYPHLPQRALDAIVVLALVLLVSCLMLIPDQSSLLMAFEILVISIAAWVLTSYPSIAGRKKVPAQYVIWTRLAFVYKQCAILPFIAGGIAMFPGVSQDVSLALALIAVGSMVCFIVGLMNSWILLVEINR